MVAFNKKSGNRPFEFGSDRPARGVAERTRDFFARHPEIARDDFLIDALQREIVFREQRETKKPSTIAHPHGSGVEMRSANRPRATAEDLRRQALLAQRLAQLHYERHGLWPRIRRFFSGDRSLRIA
jgi:hypothetical protein